MPFSKVNIDTSFYGVEAKKRKGSGGNLPLHFHHAARAGILYVLRHAP